VETLLGDASKARQKLGWTPEISLAEMIREMVAHDLDLAKQSMLLRQNGFEITTEPSE
jgi:GDPmannose 4,6-dehydratase